MFNKIKTTAKGWIAPSPQDLAEQIKIKKAELVKVEETYGEALLESQYNPNADPVILANAEAHVNALTDEIKQFEASSLAAHRVQQKRDASAAKQKADAKAVERKRVLERLKEAGRKFDAVVDGAFKEAANELWAEIQAANGLGDSAIQRHVYAARLRVSPVVNARLKMFGAKQLGPTIDTSEIEKYLPNP